jgi:GT2 family glycosyltransferase
MEEPRLSVIIPTHDGGAELRQTLAALGEQEGAFEAIVVDDGSTDGTAEMAESLRLPVPLQVLRQPHRGRAAARNLGAARAAAPVLLFLDADVRPAPGFVAGHLRHYRDGARLGVQGRTLQHPDTLTTTFMRATNLFPDLTLRRRQNLSPLHVITRNFSVAAAPFREVGGFDEAFAGYGWEDIELGLRLQQAGVRLHYEPDALAYHHHVQGLEDLAAKLRQAGAGAVYFWRKHGRPVGLGLFLEIHPALLPLKWLVYRTGTVTRLVEAVRPWAERQNILPLCSECYNHLLWRAYYDGVFAALRTPATGRVTEEAST